MGRTCLGLRDVRGEGGVVGQDVGGAEAAEDVDHHDVGGDAGVFSQSASPTWGAAGVRFCP